MRELGKIYYQVKGIRNLGAHSSNMNASICKGRFTAKWKVFQHFAVYSFSYTILCRAGGMIEQLIILSGIPYIFPMFTSKIVGPI